MEEINENQDIEENQDRGGEDKLEKNTSENKVENVNSQIATLERLQAGIFEMMEGLQAEINALEGKEAEETQGITKDF